jgi:hypothetical protein
MAERRLPVLGAGERMWPSAIAMPTSIAVTVLAIDHDVKRSRSVRPYWYRSTSMVSPRAISRPVVGVRAR